MVLFKIFIYIKRKIWYNVEKINKRGKMKKDKLLKSSIVIILISLIITIFISEKYKLDKAVFLKSYCEYPINYSSDNEYSNYQFTIKYITNINDKKKVNNIEFDNIPQVNYSYASEGIDNWMYTGQYENGENEEICGLYSVRYVNVHLSLYFDEKPLDNIVINKARVYFTDGTQQEINLGEIIFYYEDNMDTSIDFNNTSRKSNGKFDAYGSVLKDITVTKIYSPLFKYSKEYLNLNLNEVSYKEINSKEYKAGSTIYYEGKFDASESIEDLYTTFEVVPKIYYINDKGEKWYKRCRYIYYDAHNFSFRYILKYLKAMGEI